MKHLIDELHADNPHHHAMNAGDMPASPISLMTRGVHFHDSIVAIEKGPFLSKTGRSIPLVEGQTIW